MLLSFLLCFSRWAPDSKAQMSFNIWEAPDGNMRAVVTTDILHRSTCSSRLTNCWLPRPLAGGWTESLGCAIIFKLHPPRVLSFQLVVLQVSLPRQQFCSWGHSPGPCACVSHVGASAKRGQSLVGWNFSLSQFSRRRCSFVHQFCTCSWDAPLNVFFVRFFLTVGWISTNLC